MILSCYYLSILQVLQKHDRIFVSGELTGPAQNFLTNNRSGERNFAYVQQLLNRNKNLGQHSQIINSMNYGAKQNAD